MLRNLDTIYDIARSSKNFSTGINFSENIFLVYRGKTLMMTTIMMRTASEMTMTSMATTSMTRMRMKTTTTAMPMENSRIIIPYFFITSL
jgi:hypothetical protein